MNAVARLSLVVAGLAVVAYVGATQTGWRLGGIGFSVNRDRQAVYDLTRHFLDDLKFKDFTRAATYHAASDQAAANIPALIESKFLVKPEQLDIQEVRIDRVEVDADGQRAKAVTTSHVKLLNTQEIRDMEAVFYWHKDEKGEWRMQLRSSLQ